MPWWRTIRVMMTTRRPGERERQRQGGAPASPERRAALRRRRCGRSVLPVWPAFFAARITSPTKVFGRLAPWLPWRMRPGRTWRSSSRVVMAARASGNGGDGARIVEIVGTLRQERQQAGCADVPKNPTQPTTCARPKVGAFILPSVGRVPLQPLSDPQTCAGTRHAPIEHDPWSWPLIPTRCPHKQAVRLRRERRQILGDHRRSQVAQPADRTLPERSLNGSPMCTLNSGASVHGTGRDRDHHGARRSRRCRSAGQAPRRRLASRSGAVGLSRDDLRSAQDLHCRPRESRATRSGHAVRADTPRRPECCRADRKGQRRDRSEDASSPMSPA